STRSRAVSLPSLCWRSRRSGPPPSSARRCFSRRTSRRPLTGERPARRSVAASAAAAAAAAAASVAGAGAGQGEGRELLLDLAAAATRTGHDLGEGADVLLEERAALPALVFVQGHSGPRGGSLVRRLGRQLLLGLLPVLQEALEAEVGERMLQ